MKVFLTVLLMGALLHAAPIKLTPDNTVVLRNEVNDDSISKLQVELAEKVIKRAGRGYTIYLVLDSPGGSIDSGLNFIEFAKNISNLETITLFSASMAAGIVEALPGKRNILETGILMFHRAKGGVQGQFEDGELESRLTVYKKIVRRMEEANASRMCMSLSSYKDKVKDELWILGFEAVAAKAADAVVSIECSPELLAKGAVESFSIPGLGSINVKFNACPLIKAGVASEPENNDKYLKYRAEKWNVGASK
jgi:ATP-dependent protease ClpP protease subunit